MTTFDAQNKTIGRLASEVASELMGKNTTGFVRYKAPENEVKVVNLSKASIQQKKVRDTEHVRYSGYPGGLKTESLEHVIEKKGLKEVFRRAVYGMLPKNKLRAQMIKRLTIEE